jgi:hypothetical protein
VRLEGLSQLKKRSNDLIGNRTRDLPACSIVSQPTTLPHARHPNGISKEATKKTETISPPSFSPKKRNI